MRLTEEQIAAIDEWRRNQADPPSRAEAIRFILRDWLTGHGYLKHREDPEGAN